MALDTDCNSAAVSGVTFCFSGRPGGVSTGPYASLNLGYATGDDPALVQQNRSRLFEAAGCADLADALVHPRQVHGDKIARLRPGRVADACAAANVDAAAGPDAGADVGADAVVCTAPNVPVLLLFADCVPLVLIAPRAGYGVQSSAAGSPDNSTAAGSPASGAAGGPDGSPHAVPAGTRGFAVVHSGWRGTQLHIAGKAACALTEETGCPPEELLCYLGPHISAAAYKVSQELAQSFVQDFGPGAEPTTGHLDLSYCVIKSLTDVGVREDHIIEPHLCTASLSDRYFSHRAGHGHTGRHGALAYMRG